MQNTYSFRGKGSVRDAWMYGCSVIPWDNGIWTMVSPSETSFWNEFGVKGITVGMFTGIEDINGIKIYEGDLIRFERHSRNDANDTNPKIIEGVVMLEKAGFTCVRKLSKDNDFESFSLYEMYHLENSSIEVIGNMFDDRADFKRIMGDDIKR